MLQVASSLLVKADKASWRRGGGRGEDLNLRPQRPEVYNTV
jgi:hypothetical protein